MSTYGWSTFIGSTVQGRYVLQTLARAESRMAVFTALATIEQYSGEVLLTAVRGSREECQQYLRRFLEAKFLKHPNLMDVLDAGEADLQGTYAVFLVTEPAGSSLQQEETLDRESVWRLARDLVAGLGYLHSENLVYCALRPETTWRVGRTWKLGDYHELRLAGTGRAAETRSMMGRMPEVPPEAFEGIVGPAWDVWALGVTLARVLRGDSRERRAGPLPPQFESIVNRCLDPDPSARITIAELAERLNAGYESFPPTVSSAEWRASAGAVKIAAAVKGAEAVTSAGGTITRPSPEPVIEPFKRPHREKASFLAGMAGVAEGARRKVQSLFSPSQKAPRTQTLFSPRERSPRAMRRTVRVLSDRSERSVSTREVGRRSTSKWMLFPIAGAIVGATLTLFALKHEGRIAPGTGDKDSIATGGRAPAAETAAPARPQGEDTKPSPDTSTGDATIDKSAREQDRGLIGPLGTVYEGSKCRSADDLLYTRGRHLLRAPTAIDG